MKCFLTVHHVVQIAKHWKKQIKTVLQPLMYFVNAFKCTKSICQHKSFISSAVFSNSSFTISLLHHWEYTESTRSLILLTCFTEYYYTIPTYCVPVLFVPGIKVGSQRTHLWFAARLSCTAIIFQQGLQFAASVNRAFKR